jgi:hypothetical protein
VETHVYHLEAPLKLELLSIPTNSQPAPTSRTSISSPRTSDNMLASCVRETHRRLRGGQNVGGRFVGSSSGEEGAEDAICDGEGVEDRCLVDVSSNVQNVFFHLVHCILQQVKMKVEVISGEL